MEKLTRGLVAMVTPSGIFMSWRLLDMDEADVSFRIYRNGVPISVVKDRCNYLDRDGRAGDDYAVSSLGRSGESGPEGMELPMFAQNGAANGNFIGYRLVRPQPHAAIRFRNPRQDLYDATGRYYYMPVAPDRMDRLQRAVRRWREGRMPRREYEREAAEFRAYTDSLGLDAGGGRGPTLRELGYDESRRVPYRTDKDGRPVWTTAVYAVGDMTTGDLDGDGRYELIVKWDPSDAADSMISYRTTAPCIIDA